MTACRCEEAPFAELQRREVRRQWGDEYRVCPSETPDATVMYRVPAEAPIADWRHALDLIDDELVRAARCDHPSSQIEALTRLAAVAQRCAEQLGLIGRGAGW